ncbi:hypothetical protein [Kurthia sibirica]|uniref:Uncharacterized protein n=1 Tax=Kurthia sibirica TaxID=202750 RepID=A0A2U3AKF4_9BACL|nr:hypothetical protein [Kurthia sibirica]PWI24984.1 hypothetical protein DEX24_10440 [Kurthia sibirica]GEK33110.1 hypothetical protein KSI01_06430 [Kurthia sibirica]
MKLNKLIIGSVVAMSLLAGCGNSSSLSSKEPIGFYEDSQKNDRVWLETTATDGIVGKDEHVNRIIVVKDGELTAYNTHFNSENLDSIKLGSIGDKSPEELEKLGVQRDKEYFEDRIKSSIGIIEDNIKYNKKKIEENEGYKQKQIENSQKKGIYEFEKQGYLQREKEFTEEIASLDKENGDFKEQIEILKNMKYQSPKPQKINVSIDTDGTGNVTESEMLTFKNHVLFAETNVGSSKSELKITEGKYKEFTPMVVSQIHDKYYAGYLIGGSQTDALITLSDEKEVGKYVTKLDQPDTKGIKVD